MKSTSILPAIALALTVALFAAPGTSLAIGGGSSSTSTSKAMDPDYSSAVALIEKMDFQAAVPLLENVVKDDPKNADAHNYLGYSYRNLGQYDKARASYEQALAIDEEHRGALEYLGELHLKLGDLDGAKAILARLDKACFFGCEEYRQLKQKIAAYEQRKTEG